MEYSIYAVDVGSPRRGNFAWARLASEPGTLAELSTNITELAMRLKSDLPRRKVALGFEAPMFIPIPQEEGGLSRGRPGEGDRSCFAPAGMAVSMMGLQQMTRLFHQLRTERASFVWSMKEFAEATEPGTLLLWEAFVSKDAKSKGGGKHNEHEQDAEIAACQFRDDLRAGRTNKGIVYADVAFSLVGASLLWSGWVGGVNSKVADLLRQQTVVVRP